MRVFGLGAVLATLMATTAPQVIVRARFPVLVSVVSPVATGGTYDAGTATLITLAGTAASGHAVTTCTWINSAGGSGIATGTTSWSVSNAALTAGANVFTITCTNLEGVTGAASITVTSTAPLATGCTITATGLTQSLVSAAIASAVDGDVVCLPAGTADWTVAGRVFVDHAITLKGAGCTYDANNRPTSCLTTLRDADPLGNNSMLVFTLVADKTSRLTDVAFADNSGRTTGNNNTHGFVEINGANTDLRRMRVDHCWFNLLDGFSIFTNTVLGVFDHNNFQMNALASGIGVYVYHEHWNGGDHSDGSWGDADYFGTDKFLFLEHNTFAMNNGVYALTDALRGARYVVRNNDVDNSWAEMHGSDSGGRYRGTRAVEVYNNTFTCSFGGCGYMVNDRSGVVLVHDNTVSGFTSPHITLAAYRLFFSFAGLEAATGHNVVDVNAAGGPFGSSPYTASSGSGQTVTVTGAGWTTNQWVGYEIEKVGCITSDAQQCASVITGNSSSTITFADDGTYCRGVTACQLSFAASDTFKLWKVTQVMDQPCVSGGTQWASHTPGFDTMTASGTTVTVAATGISTTLGLSTGDWISVADTDDDHNYTGVYQVTVDNANQFHYTAHAAPTVSPDADGTIASITKIPSGWNNQTVDACYEWNNTQGATNINFSSDHPIQIVSGTHFFNDTAKPGYTAYTSPHPVASLATYISRFALTENPISDGGQWVTGAATGLDWHDVRSNGTQAYGTQTGVTVLDDSIAHLAGSWGTTQTAEGVVRTVNQRTDSVHEEVELLLRFSISAHSARGYECNYAARTDANRYVQIVRWNGALADFTLLDSIAGPGLNNGDTVKCTITGSTITSYINGTQVLQVTDSTWSTGAPGLGFYLDNGSSAMTADYGFTRYSAWAW